MNRATTYDEIAPFIDYCKKGMLFEAQDWITQGKPVNFPLVMPPRQYKKSPLHVSMDLGFYSLIQILAENGADLEEPRYSALEHALWKKRLDIVQLLVKNGARINSVGMDEVFDTWDKQIITFFIEHGADCEIDYPLEYALSSKIRPALSIFLQYKDRFPHFQEQVDLALRYHCREGNLKWVSLLLWAGANPHVKRPEYPQDEPEDYMSAIEIAAFCGHFKIFKLKSMHIDLKSPAAHDLLRNACYGEKTDNLAELLKNGFDPGQLSDKATSSIESLINMMTRDYDDYPWHSKQKTDIDSHHSRCKMRMLHILVRHGARWEPDDDGIKAVSKSLLKMNCDYVMEFMWIMTEYKACSFDTLQQLMNTKSMMRFIAQHRNRYEEMMNTYSTCFNQLRFDR